MGRRAHTPADAAIHPRDIVFRQDPAWQRWWMGGDPVATAYYNVFSASFPQAERFFIDSVRRYRDRADAVLRPQIAGFITQESLHTREHATFNRTAISGGYDLSRIDEFVKSRLDRARQLSSLRQVAATAALEHFTTILACEAVGNPSHLETAPAEIRRLWQWHAAEEIEHKAVAFDTFLLAAHDVRGFARWRLRCGVMVAATASLLTFLLFGMREMFRQDGIASARTWLGFAHFAFIHPGVLRRVMGRYLAFYRPGFHPWQVDDRALVAAGERAIAA
ncbi:MAG TPA: metal-dependent hydrolase [Rhizomicrobium sp.]